MCSLAIYCILIYFAKYGIAKEKVVTYEGAQVWRTNLRSLEDIQAIKELSKRQAISVWSLNRQAVDYLVHAANQRKVTRVLEDHELDQSTLIPDLQRTLDELKETPPMWNENTLRIGHRLSWTSYPTLEVITEYLVYLTKTFPALCTVTTIGYSVENRPIEMVEITNGNSNNKILMMTAGVHAREWVSVTSALYLITTLITTFNELPKHMKSIEWKIIPVLNPDGYEYSHTTDRLWRKNRRKTNHQACKGVDLNRNFGFQWYIDGVTQNCCMCASDFPGRTPFSEPETITIRDYIQRSGKLPEVFVDLHSYGQFIMHPWSWTSKHPSNRPFLNDVALKMAQAIMKANRRYYIVGDTHNLVYQASGIQMDWFYSLGVNLSFTFELRDGYYGDNNFEEYKHWQGFGFLLPPHYIEPTGNDVVAAMQTLSDIIAEKTNKLTARETIGRDKYTAKIIIDISLKNARSLSAPN